MILSFKNVIKIYKKPGFFKNKEKIALNNISFSIKKGETLALLGLNGAGKTTIIKLIVGLLKVDSGIIEIFDKDISKNNLKNKIGYLPELPYFYPYMNAEETLFFYGNLSLIEKEKLKKEIPLVLEKVGLSKNKDKKCSEFSKGMLQKLAFAQSILHNPDFIILDEPASGLDPLALKDLRNIILDLKSTGITFLMSSHSISEVEKVSDKAIILKDGIIKKEIEKKYWEENGGLEKIFVEQIV